MSIFSITDTANFWITRHLKPGARAIDATAGNGWDTLALAEAVGPGGSVYAFDTQDQAIAATRGLLTNRKLADRVEFFHACHTRLAEYVAAPVDAIMFNLGYLPHGDKATTTRLDTTQRALEQALDLLAPNGLLSLVTYPGHSEGLREHEALLPWLMGYPGIDVAHIEIIVHGRRPPHLFLVSLRH